VGVIGLTFALTTRIGIRKWAIFNVDLVGEAEGMTGEPEIAPALARIDLGELDQPGYRATLESAFVGYLAIDGDALDRSVIARHANPTQLT